MNTTTIFSSMVCSQPHEFYNPSKTVTSFHMNALLADDILTGLLYFVHEDVHVYSLFNSSLKDSYLGRQVSLIENI